MESFIALGLSMHELWADVISALKADPGEHNYHVYIHRQIQKAPHPTVAQQLINRHCEVVAEDASYSEWLFTVIITLEQIQKALSTLLNDIHDRANELDEDDDELMDIAAHLLETGDERAQTLQRKLNRLVKERAVITAFSELTGRRPTFSDDDDDEGFIEDGDMADEQE